MFIERLKKEFSVDEPIFTNEILKLFNNYSRAYIFLLINKAKNNGELIQFDNGVYYIPQETYLGRSIIVADDVVDRKYIKNRDDVYGIYSGLTLQNYFSITTQMPNVLEIVSNKESMRYREIKMGNRSYILRKSRCQITKENVYTYTIMQLFCDINTKTVLDDWSKQSIKKYIIQNNVSINDLLDMTHVFPAKALKSFLLSGVFNEITQ